MSARPVPRATYRLQMTKDFPFAAAAEIAPYLARLGISHAYLSPILRARRGSTHGYDTVDHTMLNPELGTRADFDRMAETFRRHGLGIILDIVPNHMGVGGDDNALWLDVLAWGERSRYAPWFDIDWAPPDPTLTGKLLVPFLGTSYEEALENGRLELRYDPADMSYAVWAEATHKLPLCPDSYGLVGGPDAVAGFNGEPGHARLAQLIAAQHWRPARYSVAADDINYRRFFVVSDLAAIRVERDDVFEHVHRLTFELCADGLVDGLRVDHVDGLYDPRDYCLRLRRACPRPIYLLVEKILAPHERLRADWQVEGTTGYEFAAMVNRLLSDPAAEAALTRSYVQATGRSDWFEAIERDAKRNIVTYEMAAELDALVARLRRLAVSVRRSADLTANALRLGLREIVAAMPVYRTYVDEPLAEEDRRNIAVAVGRARRAAPALDPAIFDFLNDVMTGELCRVHALYDPAATLDLARRIQQYTGPVMAKGLEDTALYRYNRLLALSDVGEKPDRFSAGPSAFHDFNLARVKATPHGMLATSTHDTKRGEDTRARILALTADPGTWSADVAEWLALLARAGAPAIDPNDAWAFFQLLLGAWPAAWSLDADVSAADLTAFRERMSGAMLKSVREARVHTNWNVPQGGYEQAVAAFVATAIRPGPFLDAFRIRQEGLAWNGALNGLIATVLKLTVPGVPDIYQGAELWEQSMVDPDNRRPVDFAGAEALLAGTCGQPLLALRDRWRDGAVKQRLIAALLGLRAQRPALFSEGSYEPVVLPGSPDVVCFLRRRNGTALLVAARLFPWREPQETNSIDLPGGLGDRQWSALWGSPPRRPLDLRSQLRDLPAAVLLSPDAS